MESDKKKSHIDLMDLVSILFIVFFVWAAYAILFPTFFYKTRATVVECVVTYAATETVQEDGRDGENSRRRLIWVDCGYTAVGAPRPTNDPLVYFTKEANKDTSITKGDRFKCSITWIEFGHFPLAFNMGKVNTFLDTRTCNLVKKKS